jgi:hypothetical protein
MADLAYYASKIAECLRLLESSSDPLYREVYQAMADEFAEKYAILSRRVAEQAALASPPSPLLSLVAPKAAMVERPMADSESGLGHASATGGERSLPQR